MVLYLGGSAISVGEYTVVNIALSLFPTTCLRATITVILGIEENGGKVDWSNIQNYYKNYSVLMGIIMLVVDGVVWVMLGLYLEREKNVKRERGRRAA